jgi:hypothetical protein
MLTQRALLSRKRCLLYWYKSTHADAEGAAQPEERDGGSRLDNLRLGEGEGARAEVLKAYKQVVCIRILFVYSYFIRVCTGGRVPQAERAALIGP